ncbi:MAG: hypothetical protein ACOC90_02905 [Bacteroidota bacterium]
MYTYPYTNTWAYFVQIPGNALLYNLPDIYDEHGTQLAFFPEKGEF